MWWQRAPGLPLAVDGPAGRGSAATRRLISTALLAVGLVGCSDPNRGTLSQHVAGAYEPCSSSEIRYLAAKHNFQTAFKECGSNNFNHFAWSPAGTHLYFSFTLSHHIMDAGAPDKKTITVPTETPIGAAGWLTAARIAIPVGPAEDDEDGPLRLAIFDLEQSSLFHVPVRGATSISEVQRGEDASTALVLGERDGRVDLWRVDLDEARVERAFSWLDGPITSFSYTHDAGAIAIGRGDEVSLYRTGDGELMGTWAPAKRATLHPDGRWLALEHDGEPVSIFYQRAWDELSEQARERELRRAQKFEDRLPEGYPKEIAPPTLTMVDLVSGERWQFTSFMGKQFQWYEPTPHYASFILWGFEGKELNPNVVLGNLTDRLRAIEQGEEMMGLARYSPPAEQVPMAAPAVQGEPPVEVTEEPSREAIMAH